MKSPVCGAEETVSPECPQCEERQQVWSSLPPPNMQLLTRQPPRLLSMEELCRGPSAECTTSVERRRSGPVRGRPQHKTADLGTDLGGLDPLPSTQRAGVPRATTGAGSSVGGAGVEGGSVRGAGSVGGAGGSVGGAGVEGAGGSVEGAGGYGSDLDLFEDEEFDRLCQDVELVYEGSSSDSGLPAVSLVPGVAGDSQHRTVRSKTKPVSYLKTEVASEHKPGSRLAAKVPPTPRQGEAARVLTPEACPMCSMQFPHGCVSQQHSDITQPSPRVCDMFTTVSLLQVLSGRCGAAHRSLPCWGPERL